MSGLTSRRQRWLVEDNLHRLEALEALEPILGKGGSLIDLTPFSRERLLSRGRPGETEDERCLADVFRNDRNEIVAVALFTEGWDEDPDSFTPSVSGDYLMIFFPHELVVIDRWFEVTDDWDAFTREALIYTVQTIRDLDPEVAAFMVSSPW